MIDLHTDNIIISLFRLLTYIHLHKKSNAWVSSLIAFYQNRHPSLKWSFFRQGKRKMKSFEDQKMWYALYVCDAIFIQYTLCSDRRRKFIM